MYVLQSCTPCSAGGVRYSTDSICELSVVVFSGCPVPDVGALPVFYFAVFLGALRTSSALTFVSFLMFDENR